MINLTPALFDELDYTLDGLHKALQHAIELEHAVMPPYLYALYSIRPESVSDGRNAEVYSLVRSVVIEEMQHMISACNVLNAVGGAPKLDHPEFIPPYPGSLPGSVEGKLIVRLRRFSIDQVRDVFREIEEPEEKDDKLTDSGTPSDGRTIGAFYRKIRDHIDHLGPSIFTGNPALQVTDLLGQHPVVAVNNVETAHKAIDLIVEQGEGTSSSPFDDGPEDEELAHYYKFEAIVRGRGLIHNPNGPPPYTFAGDPIPFDPNGVWPVVDDPKSANYPAGSQARRAADIFNYTYTNLLKVLHEAVTGKPGRVTDAVRIMESLRHQALQLVTIQLPSGESAGPSFEYQPVCP